MKKNETDNEKKDLGYKISVYHSIQAVDNWLNSDDITITDAQGIIMKEWRISCKPGSLLGRMIPFVNNE